MKSRLRVAVMCFPLIAATVHLAQAGVEVTTRPVIAPIPVSVAGTSEPVIDLNGRWKFTMSPPDNFWAPQLDTSTWSEIDVPGECLMQGFNIRRDVEYPYRKRVLIPGDFAEKKIVLRFSGVYSYARVWVNGTFIRDHHGGFTSWDCDITSAVQAGEEAVITVGVTDRSDEISWGSGYAKHNIGGILRGVRIVALPKSHLTRLALTAGLDTHFQDGRLELSTELALHEPGKAELELRLTDPSGALVPLSPRPIPVPEGAFSTVFNVSSPAKWDAEHPNLYQLTCRLLIDGKPVEELQKRFGFRRVEQIGNKVFVNGSPIKLLGVNRHDVHPTSGRSVPKDLDRLDVELMKEANVNFIRTSHYPPSEEFLEACDEIGMYVQEESAVCFVGTHGNQFTSDNPDFADRYLSQFAEMIERDRSHPSVIIWSLGNESRWGENFARQYEHAKSVDPSRPVIFSYPGTVPTGTRSHEIMSWHYPDWRDNLGRFSTQFPVLLDEFAHVACYNTDTLRRDPNVRSFWGESIARFSEDIYTTDGVLGGAIWGMIDEVFQIPVSDPEVTDPARPEARNGYGPWGIIDGWRRQKPEFWHVKKAYSPLRIEEKSVNLADNAQAVVIHVSNRHNHTNLNELSLEWSTSSAHGKTTLPSIAPGRQGEFSIAGPQWQEGEVLHLRFLRGERLVDEYNISVTLRGRSRFAGFQGEPPSPPPIHFAGPSGPAPVIRESADSITIAGELFEVVFNRRTGLIERASVQGETLIEGGPFLQLGGIPEGEWQLTTFEADTQDNSALLKISGRFGEVPLKYEIRIDGRGLIQTTYELPSPPPFLPPRGPGWAGYAAGYDEVGIYFVLSDAIDRNTWKRKAFWTSYPAGHLGAAEGTAHRHYPGGKSKFGNPPEVTWEEDSTNFYLNGRTDAGERGSNTFRAMREYVWESSAYLRDSSCRVRAESNAAIATRLEPTPNLSEGSVRFYLLSRWNYPQLGWGNYLKEPVQIEPGFKETVTIRLTGAD